MKLPFSTRDLEVRLCSVVTVLAFLSTCAAMAVFLRPYLYYATKIRTQGDCEVAAKVRKSGAECRWSSCRDSCTGEESAPCHQLFARHGSQEIRLYAGVLHCGFAVNCSKFFVEHVPGMRFRCELFEEDGSTRAAPLARIDPTVYLVASAAVALVLLGSATYTVLRKVFHRGYKPKEKADKPARKKCRSFYEQKLAELERLRQKRLERERLAMCPAEARGLQAVTALVLKPSVSWMGPALTPKYPNIA